MPKMASMLIYGKKDFRNWKADDMETWYAALPDWLSLPDLFKW